MALPKKGPSPKAAQFSLLNKLFVSCSMFPYSEPLFPIPLLTKTHLSFCHPQRHTLVSFTYKSRALIDLFHDRRTLVAVTRERHTFVSFIHQRHALVVLTHERHTLVAPSHKTPLAKLEPSSVDVVERTPSHLSQNRTYANGVLVVRAAF